MDQPQQTGVRGVLHGHPGFRQTPGRDASFQSRAALGHQHRGEPRTRGRERADHGGAEGIRRRGGALRFVEAGGEVPRNVGAGMLQAAPEDPQTPSQSPRAGGSIGCQRDFVGEAQNRSHGRLQPE